MNKKCIKGKIPSWDDCEKWCIQAIGNLCFCMCQEKGCDGVLIKYAEGFRCNKCGKGD